MLSLSLSLLQVSCLISKSHGSQKGGPMIRSGLKSNSKHYSLFQTGHGTLVTQWRQAASADTSSSKSETGHAWLKIAKKGSLFSSYFSTDGSSWELLSGPEALNFGDFFFAGIAVSSGTNAKSVIFKGGECPGYAMCPCTLPLNPLLHCHA